MFKKIKDIKNKTIIIGAIVGIFFVSATIYLVISNIQLNNKVDNLITYTKEVSNKIGN